MHMSWRTKAAACVLAAGTFLGGIAAAAPAMASQARPARSTSTAATVTPDHGRCFWNWHRYWDRRYHRWHRYWDRRHHRFYPPYRYWYCPRYGGRYGGPPVAATVAPPVAPTVATPVAATVATPVAATVATPVATPVAPAVAHPGGNPGGPA